MNPFGSTTSAIDPFAFAEAGRAFFQCAPRIEKLLSADQQPLLDLKYLRLAHSIIQDAVEAEQNGEPSSLPTADRELVLYLEAIRDCTATIGHLRHQNSSDLPRYAQTQDELSHSLREARICSEQLQYRVQESFRLSRHLHVDHEVFAQWLHHPPLQPKDTNQWQDCEYEFLDILKKLNSAETEEQGIVWLKREAAETKPRKHLRRRIRRTLLSVSTLLGPPVAPELGDYLCDLLWQIVTSRRQDLSIVCKCWFLSHQDTRPLLEDVKRMLQQETRQQNFKFLVLDVDQCYDHMESIFPNFQEILNTGCKIFLLSWRSVPDCLNAAGLVQAYLPAITPGGSSIPLIPGQRFRRFGSELRLMNSILSRLISDTSPDSRVALNVLIWKVFALQMLTTEQIQAAIGSDFKIFLESNNTDPDGTSSHIPRLESLVSIGNGIRLHSEQQLFQSKLLGIEGIPQGGVHALLTEQCLSYISTACDTGNLPNTLDELEELLRRFPLLQYAGQHWGDHAEKIETLSSQLLDSITAFLESRQLEQLAAMLLSNADQDARGYKGAYNSMTGLHLACAFGLVKVVPQMLHSRKFSTYLRTEGGWTALHWATLRRKVEMVSFLLSLPGSTSLLSLTTSVERWTALHLAAKEGCPSLVKNLATDKTIIDKKDRWGRTPLYLACWRGNVASVEHLLSQGANPNIGNLYGTTLHCAVKRRDPDLVRALIRTTIHPLDLNIPNPIQLTALEEAQRRGLDDIASILLDAGAKSGHSLQCASHQRAVQTSPLNSASTFHWRCYEVDPGLSCQVRRGKQCKGDVLRLVQQESLGAPEDAKIKLQSRVPDGEPGMPKYAFRKTFDIVNDTHGKIQKYLLSEWQILSKLEHPHISRYLDSDEDPYRNEFLLYMEYCDHGDLALRHGLSLEDLPAGDNKKYGFTDDTTIQGSEVRPLAGVEIWAMIWQLASALAYLHYGLSVKRKDSACTAFFEEFWSYVIHRDVKPANVVLQSTDDNKYIFKLCDLGIATDAGKGPDQNQTQFGGSSGFQPPEVRQGEHWTTRGDLFSLGETIRSTCKVRDGMLDSKAFRDFLDSTRQADCDSRIDSLTAMEVAYENLLPVSFGRSKLPQLVIEEMSAIHRLLGCGQGGYLIQSFVATARLLDIPDSFGDSSSKVKRTSVVNRLWLLLDDGAEETFWDREDMPKMHLLVLLDGRKRVEKASRLRQLDETLKNESDVNLQWPESGWTALHLAAQEGKLEVVQTLLNHRSKTNVKDKHGKTAMHYARDNGCAEVAALLAPSDLAETKDAFHLTKVVERSAGENTQGVRASTEEVEVSTQELESSRGLRRRIRERWVRLLGGLRKR